MTAPSTRRRVRGACAGLATAAVTVAGLTCQPATAAEIDAFPATLPFEPADLTVGGADVFAVGTDFDEESSTAFVAEVAGGEPLGLGPGTTASAAAATPDGSTVYVLGSQELTTDSPDGPTSWTYDTLWSLDVSAWELSVEKRFEQGSWTAGVEVGADGEPYVFGLDGESEGRVWDGPTLEPSALDFGGATPMLAAEAPGENGARYFAGRLEGELGESTPMMWRADADGMTTVALGHEGQPATDVTALAVDPTSGVAYAAVADSTEDYSYGLNVVDGETVSYVPIRDQAWSLALSPGGTALYAPTGSGVAAFDTDDLASYDTEDNSPPVTYVDGWLSHVVAAPDGRVYADDQNARQVFALEAPAPPTALQANAAEWTNDTITASWQASAASGGASADSLTYTVTAQDRAGGAPVVEKDRWVTDAELSGLTPGHTYDLTVVATTGAFHSTPVSTTVTLPGDFVAHPSAVTVRGTAVVGGRLTLHNTGSWAPGTTLSYAWYADQTKFSTAASVRLTKAQLGRRVWVTVEGTKAGATAYELYTDLTAKVAPGRLAKSTPKVAGKAKVGKVLTAKAGTWTPGTRLAYRWLANGKAVKAAKSKKLRLTKSLRGKRISVKVVGKQAGYRTAAAVSKKTAKVRG